MHTGHNPHLDYSQQSSGRRLLATATPIGSVETISRSSVQAPSPASPCDCPVCPEQQPQVNETIFDENTTVIELRDTGVTTSHCINLVQPMGMDVVKADEHTGDPLAYFFGGLVPGLLCIGLMISPAQLWKSRKKPAKTIDG